MKLISSFISQRKFGVSVEGLDIWKPGVPQGSGQAPHIVKSVHKRPPPHAIGVHLTLFVDNTCLYATDRKEFYVVMKLQCGLDSMLARYERWNIKSNENKAWTIYFSHWRAPPEPLLTLNGWNISL
jgi:hypothetical protein